MTSRRVSEDLQTVPISVSAFTPDQIAAQGIVNITDVAMTTPNLHMAPAIGTSNTASISLRGQYQQENLLRSTRRSGFISMMSTMPETIRF